jgi:hypothetical protein
VAATGYAIRVRGVLDPGWSSWFEGMEVRSDRPGESVISGPVADQAALHGLLEKIRDLRELEAMTTLPRPRRLPDTH